MNMTSARLLAVGLPLAAVAVTGAALAYWTAPGSGDAAGSAAAEASPVTLATATPVSGLVPGGSITVPVQATNPNATTSVAVSTLNAGTVTSDKTGCAEVAGATVTVAAPAGPVVIAPQQSAAFGSVTITMANSATVNQDACKGAVFAVALTAS